MSMISDRTSIVGILVLSLCLILSTLASSPNDEIAVIRQRTLQTAIWPPAANMSETIQNAKLYSSTLNSSCYWPDVDYKNQDIVDWDTVRHLYKISTMLKAITADGSTIKNDPKIMANVHCALNVWLTNDWQNPNWWYNQINVPLESSSQLLMLGDNATSMELSKIVEISFRAAWWFHRPTNVGANLVWMLQVQIYRSLATNNASGLQQAFSRMWQEAGISLIDEQGLRPDWTYHFHGPQLMSGASYGILWITNLLLFFQCSYNTTYQPDEGTLFTIGNYLIQGDAWMIIGNQWDWSVVGREVSSPGNGMAHGLQPNWIRTAAELTQTNETRVALMNFANRLDNIPNTPLLIGNRHFFSSDYQVHRRANWISAIKMQSVRTGPAECLNGQNLKDEHAGQGVLNLYRAGFNDYTELFAIIDWQAMNGITVEHDIALEVCDGGTFDLKKLTFVGGVSDGQYGLAMMDTASHNLTAQRSWHFYDDAIIALATNLTVNSTSTAWTTLASRLLPTGQISVGFFNSTIVTLQDGNYSFAYGKGKTSAVQWIHLEDSNIGYILPDQKGIYASLGIEVGTKSGNYDEIGPYNQTVTARMTTVYIDHGRGPYTLNYNYMIVPNVPLASMPTVIQQYNDEKVFQCISTNGLFHGTVWPTLKRAAFVLWENVTTSFRCDSPTFSIEISLSDAGAYLYSETESDFTLTASHPYRLNGTLEVSVNRVGEGEGCIAAPSSINYKQLTHVIFTLPIFDKHAGTSVVVKCTKYMANA